MWKLIKDDKKKDSCTFNFNGMNYYDNDTRGESRVRTMVTRFEHLSKENKNSIRAKVIKQLGGLEKKKWLDVKNVNSGTYCSPVKRRRTVGQTRMFRIS